LLIVIRYSLIVIRYSLNYDFTKIILIFLEINPVKTPNNQ